MEGIIAVIMVFSIPLAGILAGTYLKAKKLDAAAGPNPQLLRELERVSAEARELRTRVEALETIVTSDFDSSLSRKVRVSSQPEPTPEHDVAMPHSAARRLCRSNHGSNRSTCTQRRQNLKTRHSAYHHLIRQSRSKRRKNRHRSIFRHSVCQYESKRRTAIVHHTNRMPGADHATGTHISARQV